QGVELVTPQLHLATIPDSPYATLPELYLVAYDPATDFVLKPWLEHDPIGVLRLGEAVGGFAVSGTDGGANIQLFGYPLKLVRSLEETGGDVDQVLFVSFDTAQALLEHVQAQPNPAFEIQPESISSAMVKVRLGSDPHDVAVRILEEVYSVIPIESTGFFQTQRSQMVGLLRIVLILTGLTWILATLFMGFVFSLAANGRRREVATIRALGATGNLVLKVLLLEGVLLAFSGGIMGLGTVVLGTGLLRGWISNLMNIDVSLPPALLLLGLVALALTLTVFSVMVAAWIPTTRLSKQDLAIAMRE
ncbi:MAG: ABC transporter permease, partial [Anaerolineales bacterium]